jgi:hypothetical protein
MAVSTQERNVFGDRGLQRALEVAQAGQHLPLRRRRRVHRDFPFDYHGGPTSPPPGTLGSMETSASEMQRIVRELAPLDELCTERERN